MIVRIQQYNPACLQRGIADHGGYAYHANPFVLPWSTLNDAARSNLTQMLKLT